MSELKNTVILGDCMDYMVKMKDNEFDLCIVDPPYGIGASKGTSIVFKNFTWVHAQETHKYESKDWDSAIPQKDYFIELMRISKNQIIWGGNYFTQHLKSNNGWIIWDKQTTNKIFSPFEMAWTSYSKPKMFRFLMEGYKKEVQEDYRLGRIHPTQKPYTMYKWILKNYAECKTCKGTGLIRTGRGCMVDCPKCDNKKVTILDTHVGSGSSRIACWEMGYDFTGYEIDKDYWEAQEKRFNIVKNQMRLF